MAGILLIGGTVTLVAALIFRDPQNHAATPIDPGRPADFVLGETFEPIDLGAPPGSEVVSAELDGNLALISVRLPSALDRIYVVDLASGLVQEIRLGSP